MDKFLNWLLSNPNLATFIVILTGLLLLTIILIYLVGFIQGRKVSFWPPSIGEKPESLANIRGKTLLTEQADKTLAPVLSYTVNPLHKKYGLIEFYNMQDQAEQSRRNAETKELILRGNMFYLLAFSAASYIDPGIKRHWDYLKSKLDKGAPLQILLMDPFHKEKRYRDKLNGISTSFDPKFRLDLLVNLYNRYSNVNIRISAQNIYCSLFFSEQEMIYDPYHLGKIGDRLENNFFATRIGSSENIHSYFYVLKAHFDQLWSTSEDFEAFVKRQHSKLVMPFEKVEIKFRVNKQQGRI